ncbi:DUF4157 domain-containing protein [Aquimarina sp. LLG6339-5]|uniref:eCIS core domain-containing protein n=1 Tax=Aquimarina sp. LLG6339-5 TaxID=3160830 RepID=UPI00386882EA
MKTPTDKNQEPQHSITPRVASESSNGGTAQLKDNRTSSISQRKLRSGMDSMDNSNNPIQRKTSPERLAQSGVEGSRRNNTGLPDNLKSGIENLSGYSMDDVKVHYNSSKPAQLQAHAYAQGTDIHLAPGQEKHLPHEAWHVVQQKQGRVQPTRQLKSKININDDAGLEKEADVMGAKALNSYNITEANQELYKDSPKQVTAPSTLSNQPVQRLVWTRAVMNKKHPGKEQGKLYCLLDSYELEISKGKKANSENLVNYLTAIIKEARSILEFDIEVDIGNSINNIIEDAEQEKKTFEVIYTQVEPSYTFNNEDVNKNIDFKLDRRALKLFEEGSANQGYFGAVDLTTGIVYLLPGYNKKVKLGKRKFFIGPRKKIDKKAPENWVAPKNMKKDWSEIGEAVLADPLGQNSGQGHMELAKRYSLDTKKGNVIGFGIMKGKHGNIKWFRNRSSSMNFNAINWENKDRISLFRSRSIPDDLSNKLLRFLRTNLPNTKGDVNTVAKNGMHSQSKLASLDRGKYLSVLKASKEEVEDLMNNAIKTNNEKILNSRVANNDTSNNSSSDKIETKIDTELVKLKEKGEENSLQKSIKFLEELLEEIKSKNVNVEKANCVKDNVKGLGEAYNLLKNLDEELLNGILDLFFKFQELVDNNSKAGSTPEIYELDGVENKLEILDKVGVFNWKEGELINYKNYNYVVQDIEEVERQRKFILNKVGVRVVN